MAQGDIETPAIFTRAMRKIQSLLNLQTGVAGNGSQTYPDTVTGIAATQDTEYFWVPGPDGLTLYQNDNGTAVEAGDYPSSGAVNYNGVHGGIGGTGPLSDVEGIPILVTIGRVVNGKVTLTVLMDHRTHDGQDIGKMEAELTKELSRFN